MSTTVDERVVQMRFNNSDFESNVQTSLSTLDKLKQSLNFSDSSKGFDNISNSAKKVSFNSLANGVEAIKVKFSALEVMAVTALANITNSVVNTGKQMLHSLTIEPIKQGFDEYELKMDSIQTIMAGTGESLGKVGGYLDELNTYADKTIYSFSDMTSNIGKFTNAGVGLKDAVKAIQGISNEAAVSGANTEEASRAMYNFAQALSAGSVKLIDWKSIENANMATKEFKQQLLNTAIQMGTVEKTADGMYRTITTNAKGERSDAFNATKSFNDSLQHQWMTTDVLVKTLGKYSDETTKIGKKAFAAAQDVKTFSQLMDTLKEAVGSGWSQTWEIVFGDFNQAKKLWTEVSDVFGGMIDSQSKARNELLQGWKDLGGRKDLIQSFRNSFEALGSVLKPIKEAFREIFPATTAKQLYNITNTLKKFTNQLILSDSQSKKVKTTFKGLFAILDIGITAIKAVVKGAVSLLKAFSGLGDGILDITAYWGKWYIHLHNTIQETNVFEKTVKKATSVFIPMILKVKEFLRVIKEKIKMPGFDSFVKVMNTIWDVVSKIGSKISMICSGIGDALSNAFKSGDIASGLDIINGGLFTALLVGVKKFVGGLTDTLDNAGGILSNVTGILDSVRGCFEAYQQNLKANVLLKIAAAIGILAASILVISTIDSQKLTESFTAITGLFGELMGSLAIFTRISGNMKGTLKACTMMISMSVSINLLAIALKKLSTLDTEQIQKGLLAIGGLMTELAVFLNFAKLDGKMTGTATGILILSGAMVVLASAAKKFGDMSWTEIEKGLVSVGALLTEISVFTKLTGNAKHVVSTGTAMVLLGASMKILASALKDFGSMNWEEIGRGLTVMAGALAEVTITMNLLPKNMVGLGTGLVIVASALKILANAISDMGGMSWEEIGRGLTVMGGALAELAIGLNVMNGTLAGSAAMIIAAGALAVLTPILKTLGDMSWEEIAHGLTALAGAFTIIGVAGLVLTPLVPTITALAGSFALFGVSILGIGTGLLAAGAGISAIAAGFGMLATITASSATAIVASLTIIVTGIAGLIPTVVQRIGDAIITFCKVIAEGAPEIANAVKAVIINLVDVLVQCVPKIVDGVFVLLEKVLSTLVEYAPTIIQAAMNILIELLQGIANNIGKVTQTAIDVVIAFIQGITKKIPDVIQAAFNLIISFINGLTGAINKNAPVLAEAVKNLILAILNAAVTMLTKGIDLFKTIGSKIMNSGFIKGIKENASNVVNAVSDFVKKGVKAITDTVSDWKDAGINIVKGVVQGIKDKIGDAVSAAKDMAKSALNAAKKFLGIHSPSRVFAQIGGYVVDGFVNGVNKNQNKAANATKNLSKVGVEAAKSVLKSLKSSNSVFKEYVDNTEKNGKKVKITLKMAANAFKSFRNSVKDSIKGSMDIFDEFTVETDVTAKSLMKNLKSQITGITEWADNIRILADRGINKGLLKTLSDMGPSGAKYVNALITMSDKELKKLNKLYKTRMSLNGKAADEIVTSFLNGGKKATKAYANGIKNSTKDLKISSGSTGAIVASNMVSGSIKAVEQMKSKLQYIMRWTYDGAVDEMKSSLKYGKKAFQQFCNEYLSSTKNLTLGNKAIEAASKAITTYGKQLYKESDYYEEDTKNLKTHKKELTSLQKERAKLQKQLKKAQKSNTKASKARVKVLKKELAENKKSITEAKEQIKADEKEIAAHTKEVFDNLHSTLSESVSTFLNPLKVSIESGIDLFKKWESNADLYETDKKNLEAHQKTLDELEASQKEIQNEINKYADQNTLAARKRVKELKTQLSEVESSIEEAKNNIAQDEDDMASHSEVTVDSILANMQSQITGVTQWQNNLQTLASKGVSQGLLDKLKSMGTDGVDYVDQFMKMTSDEITKANDLFAQSESLSSSTLITNFKDTLTEAQNWADGMQKLASKGFSQDLLEKLGDMGVDGYDYVKAFLGMTPEQVSEFNQQFADSLKLPDTIADQVISSYAYAGGASIEGFTSALSKLAENGSDENAALMATATEIGNAIKDALNTPASEAGKSTVNTLAKGMKSNKETAKNSSKTIANATLKALKNVLNSTAGKSVADNIVSGLKNGLNNSKSSVSETAKAVAKAALASAKAALGIHSPSREFAEIGKYTDEGFIKGMLSGASGVSKTATEVMGNTIKAVSDAIDSDIDAEPTIRPVMDLTEIQNGANRIEKLMSGYGISESLDLANKAANGLNATNIQSDTTLNAINKLQKTLSGILNRPNVEQNNNFNIASNNPNEVANQVSHILQQQIERRESVWG